MVGGIVNPADAPGGVAEHAGDRGLGVGADAHEVGAGDAHATQGLECPVGELVGNGRGRWGGGGLDCVMLAADCQLDDLADHGPGLDQVRWRGTVGKDHHQREPIAVDAVRARAIGLRASHVRLNTDAWGYVHRDRSQMLRHTNHSRVPHGHTRRKPTQPLPKTMSPIIAQTSGYVRVPVCPRCRREDRHLMPPRLRYATRRKTLQRQGSGFSYGGVTHDARETGFLTVADILFEALTQEWESRRLGAQRFRR